MELGPDGQFGSVGVAGPDVAGLELFELLGCAEFVCHDGVLGGCWWVSGKWGS